MNDLRKIPSVIPPGCDEPAALHALESMFQPRAPASYATEDLLGRSHDLLNCFASEFPVAGWNCLDLCCGHGAMARCLVLRGAASALGVDHCANPGSRFNSPPLPALRFLSSDVHRIPAVPDHSIDGITIVNSLQYLDTKKLFLEIVRVLRPGGKVLIQAGPLYYSAWGGGVYDAFSTPFVHLIFSSDTIRKVLQKTPRYLKEINSLTLSEFYELCRLFRLHVVRLDKRVAELPEKLIARYPALLKRYPVEDLELEGFNCVLQYQGGIFADEPPPCEDLHAPPPSGLPPPRPLHAYLLQMLRVAGSMAAPKTCRVAVYGAGAHSRWMERIMAAAPEGLPQIAAVLDDDPKPGATFWGMPPIKPEALPPGAADAVFISSDRPSHARMAERARQLWKGKLPVLDPYDGFHPGPYHKDHFHV